MSSPAEYYEAQFAREEMWQAAVVTWARGAGWLVHFVPDSLYRRSFSGRHKGHALDLGDRGFPDLTLIGQGRVLFRELKVGRNGLSAHQERWRDALLAAGADWALWHPRDTIAIQEELDGAGRR